MATGYGKPKVAQRQGFFNMASFPLETLSKEHEDVIRDRITRYREFLAHARGKHPTGWNLLTSEMYETLLGACEDELARRAQ